MAYWMDLVRCPFPECTYTAKRSNMWLHIRSQKHRAELGGDPDDKVLKRSWLDRATIIRSDGGDQRTQAARASRAPATDVVPTRVPRQNELVRCPVGTCTSAPLMRQNLPRHLTGVHKWSTHRASAARRELRAWDRILDDPAIVLPAAVPAVVRVVQEEIPTIPNSFAEIDPTDIAIAVVQSQVNGHGLPMDLIPDLIAYVDTTRTLVARIREHPEIRG